MNYKDFIVNYPATHLPELYNDWLWLITEQDLARPLAMTTFGDLFFQKDGDEVYFLDTLEGTVKPFAQSPAGMKRTLESFDGQSDFLFSDLVLTLRERGVTLDNDQLYLFKVHPKIGGRGTSDNVEVASMRIALSLTGQLHRQVK